MTVLHLFCVEFFENGRNMMGILSDVFCASVRIDLTKQIA